MNEDHAKYGLKFGHLVFNEGNRRFAFVVHS